MLGAGENCEYRHADTIGRQLCIPWTIQNCYNPDCILRHIYDERDIEPCYYESTRSGCLNERCPYFHYGTNAPTQAIPPPLYDISSRRATRSKLIPELCYGLNGHVTLREKVDNNNTVESSSSNSLLPRRWMNDSSNQCSEYPLLNGYFEEYINIPPVIIPIDSD
ncbi:hypothetical protein GJ496_007117 [Pomphorhynchus laevis]|nr:hypothetical protein GJ496_007117 [Pomphorhynchus laevis]